MTMHAPQIIFCTLMLIGYGIHAAKHGQKREPYNGGVALLDVIITSLLLWWGGFFG